MFVLKLIKPSPINVRLNQRYISGGSGRLLGIFSKDKAEESSPEDTIIQVIDNQDEFDVDEKQRKIESIRNKSGLRTAHRNLVHGKLPYKVTESWVHDTLNFKRKMFGKYGAESLVDPRVCFLTKAELADKQEYQRVAFPLTVPEMIKIEQSKKKAKQDSIEAREAYISKNLLKLGQWKKDIIARQLKRETDARVAKERKDRLIEEVRRHFGYTIDPRDDRFKELLEQKEKEQRKALKESKRADKEAKLMEKIVDGKKTKKDKKAATAADDQAEPEELEKEEKVDDDADVKDVDESKKSKKKK